MNHIIIIDGIPENKPVKDHGQAAGSDIVIHGGMKGGNGHRAQHPAYVIASSIGHYDKHGHDQVQQQQAPAFAHMNVHFVEVGLYKVAADHKGHNQ